MKKGLFIFGTRRSKFKLNLFLEKYLFPLAFLFDNIRCYKYFLNEKVYAKNKNFKNFFDLKNDLEKERKKYFFIFGGGSSINLITNKQWKFIKSNTSLGLNMFFVHKYTPDFSMIEGFRKNELETPEFNWFKKNLKKIIKEKKTTLLLKDYANSFLDWSYINKYYKDKSFCIPKFNVPGRTNNSTRKNFKFLKFFNIHKNLPFFSRSSVTLAISIGYLLGYENIILCGFDMNNGKYFFQEPKFLKNPKIDNPVISLQDSNKVHSTVNPNVNKVTVDESIVSFNETILKPEKINLFINHDSSKLFPRIDLFKWDLIKP